MDRSALLLIALALLCASGLVTGVAGLVLFKRDRAGFSEAEVRDSAEAAETEPGGEGT